MDQIERDFKELKSKRENLDYSITSNLRYSKHVLLLFVVSFSLF